MLKKMRKTLDNGILYNMIDRNENKIKILEFAGKSRLTYKICKTRSLINCTLTK